jgi:hypothetical protein
MSSAKRPDENDESSRDALIAQVWSVARERGEHLFELCSRSAAIRIEVQHCDVFTQERDVMTPLFISAECSLFWQPNECSKFFVASKTRELGCFQKIRSFVIPGFKAST